METQPENRKNKVSSEEILEVLLAVKGLAEEERKAKEQKNEKNGSYQTTYSFVTT